MSTNTPAPGDLELVRAFVNTLDIEGATDEFATVDGLKAWYFDRDLIQGDAAAGEDDRLAALRVRGALRRLLFSNHGEPVDPGAVEVLNAAFSSLPLEPRLAAGGTPFLASTAGGAPGALGRVLGMVFASMSDGTWPRLKICRADACQWAFYDHSRNRSGNWCSMAVCGNRTKVRKYQQRARLAASED